MRFSDGGGHSGAARPEAWLGSLCGCSVVLLSGQLGRVLCAQRSKSCFIEKRRRVVLPEAKILLTVNGRVGGKPFSVTRVHSQKIHMYLSYKVTEQFLNIVFR